MKRPVAKVQGAHEVSAGAGGGAFLFGCALVAVALAATANELLVYLAKTKSYAAQRAAKRGDDEAALGLTRAALRLDSGNTQAMYLRCVRLQATKQEAELAALLPEALAFHPNQASVRRLASDAPFRKGENAAAAEALWGTFWINPLPPASPANYWRRALAAERGRGGAAGARLAAAVRAADLAERDRTLRPADRRALYMDVAAEFQLAGAPGVAGHLTALAGRER